MQNFSKEQIEKLRSFLKVKDAPGECEKKLWEKVAKYTPLLRKIPGVLCICVGNSLAMNACHKNSDIDLFVITKKNRLWTARILMTFLFSVLGERKTAKKHAGKFCLSFFITENALNFDAIAIKNDVYLRYWIENLQPILNRGRTFEKFLETNKITQHLSPTLPCEGREQATDVSHLSCQETSEKQSEATVSKLKQSRRSELQIFKKMKPLSPSKEKGQGELRSKRECPGVFRIEGKQRLKADIILGNILEKLLKTLFLPKTKKSFQKLGKPYGVIITDDILKFHNKDRRVEICNKIFSSP